MSDFKHGTALIRGIYIIFMLLLMAQIQNVQAVDWGLQYQGGANEKNIALSYAERDLPQNMREWYLGCRELDRSNTKLHEKEKARGCGLAFSWRYYFRPLFSSPRVAPRTSSGGSFFLGVRNDWWRLYYEWEDDLAQADNKDAVQKGRSTVDSLTPAAIVGWSFGDATISYDIYFSVGNEFNVITDGKDVSDGSIILGGIGIRF